MAIVDLQPIPRVRIFQNFMSVSTAVTDSLRAWIVGPNAVLHRYNSVDEKPTTALGAYNPDQDTEYEYPDKSYSSVVDKEYAALYVDSANLVYFEDLTGSTSENPDITASMDVANLIISESLAFRSNGAQYPRSAVFGDRDVQIGDSVEIVGRVQGGSAGCVENTFTSKVLGFVPTVSAGSVGEVTKQSDLDNAAAEITVTSSNSMSVYNATNPEVPLTADIEINAAGMYNGIASGFIKESYTVYLTKVIKTAGCEEVLANVISGSGTDNVNNVSITSGGTFRIGTRGVTGSVAAADYANLLAGMQWKLEASQAYSAPEMTTDDDYLGPDNDTYIVTCIVGGTVGTETPPRVQITTQQGTDAISELDITAASTMFMFGRYNLSISFDKPVMAYGETYTFPVFGYNNGRINGLLLRDTLPAEFQIPGAGLDVRLSVIRNTQVPQISDISDSMLNFTLEDETVEIAGGIQVQLPEFTDGAEYIPLKLRGGNMYLEYREWVPTLDDNIYFAEGTDSLKLIPGALDPDNPLKWGVYKALSNANGTAVAYTAVSHPDSLDAWTTAVSRIDGRTDVYTPVPLTCFRPNRSSFTSPCRIF